MLDGVVVRIDQEARNVLDDSAWAAAGWTVRALGRPRAGTVSPAALEVPS